MNQVWRRNSAALNIVFAENRKLMHLFLKKKLRRWRSATCCCSRVLDLKLNLTVVTRDSFVPPSRLLRFLVMCSPKQHIFQYHFIWSVTWKTNTSPVISLIVLPRQLRGKPQPLTPKCIFCTELLHKHFKNNLFDIFSIIISMLEITWRHTDSLLI